MNRGSQDKSSAGATQGVSGQGDRVVDLLARQRRMVFRIAAIEGDPIEADEPDPQVVRGVRELFNDPHPGLADLLLGLLEDLEHHFDRIERRQDRALKILVVRRRAAFTVIDGGRHD